MSEYRVLASLHAGNASLYLLFSLVVYLGARHDTVKRSHGMDTFIAQPKDQSSARARPCQRQKQPKAKTHTSAREKGGPNCGSEPRSHIGRTTDAYAVLVHAVSSPPREGNRESGRTGYEPKAKKAREGRTGRGAAPPRMNALPAWHGMGGQLDRVQSRGLESRESRVETSVQTVTGRIGCRLAIILAILRRRLNGAFARVCSCSVERGRGSGGCPCLCGGGWFGRARGRGVSRGHAQERRKEDKEGFAASLCTLHFGSNDQLIH